MLLGCRDDASLSGKGLYDKYCAECHGVNGDGNGVKSATLPVKPFDLSAATFKFRSTPYGALPTDEDILRTLTRGSTHKGLSGWESLPDAKRRAVVEHLKTFAGRWKMESPPKPISLPPAPSYVGTSESVSKGKKLYQRGQCWQCHGHEGHGDGAAADSMTDNWGNPIRPADFAVGFKGGNAPEDIYRTLSTGLNGTPMPSYAEVFSAEERWHLASYVLALAKEKP